MGRWGNLDPTWRIITHLVISMVLMAAALGADELWIQLLFLALLAGNVVALVRWGQGEPRLWK